MVNDTVNIIYELKDGYSFEFILGLLNSKFISKWFNLVFPKGLHIKINQLAEIPIPIKPNQKDISSSVNLIIEKNKEYNDVLSQFTNLVVNKFPNIKLRKKLEWWHELSASEFIKELENLKVNLTLSEESKWIGYFNEQKLVMQQLKFEIEKIDKQINQLVYELYELTPEEIKIVEGQV